MCIIVVMHIIYMEIDKTTVSIFISLYLSCAQCVHIKDLFSIVRKACVVV